MHAGACRALLHDRADDQRGSAREEGQHISSVVGFACVLSGKLPQTSHAMKQISPDLASGAGTFLQLGAGAFLRSHSSHAPPPKA